MDDTTKTAAVPAAPKRARRKTATTAKARTARHGYKKQLEAVQAENARLTRRVAQLESRAGSEHEQTLILKGVEHGFKAGLETGLMLQDVK